MANTNLHKAKQAKNDEFYTQLTDVEKELRHYKNHFKDKIIFCNCDDPTWSAFWEYFHLNFAELGLKKLISTHYDAKEKTYKLEYTGGNDNDTTVGVKTDLLQNGDFRSEECIELLKEADIVVTNPPFSLYRSFVAQLMEYNKKFIIWSNNNSITYKEIFPLIKENKMWLGYMANKTCIFRLSDDYEKYDEKITEEMNDGHRYGKVPAISVFTNLDIPKRHEDLILWQRYYDDNGNPIKGIEEKYPHYDNYNAINVDKVSDIPCDYYECIGVPITFLDKYNPDQFEIIRFRKGEDGKDLVYIRPNSKIVNVERESSVILPNHHQKNTETNSQEMIEQLSMVDLSMQEYLSVEKIKEILIKDFGYSAEDIQYCNGIMGVPITFLDKYNPDVFEIVECHEPAISLTKLKSNKSFKEYKSRQILVNNVLCQKTYHRYFIKKR